MITLPSASQCQVWLDFDGTMTRRDLLDDLIVRYSVDDSWKEIEQRWQAGTIGSRDCLAGQFALLRVGDAELDEFLDRVQIDPGLIALIAFLDQFNVPRAVLSDGIDLFIQRTLSRNNLSLPVKSNTIERRGLELILHCPHNLPDCRSAAAHCKCASMAELSTPGRTSIYVGDGRSDLCPSRRADVVFAKGALATALEREGRPFLRFETLLDVRADLSRAWSD